MCVCIYLNDFDYLTVLYFSCTFVYSKYYYYHKINIYVCFMFLNDIICNTILESIMIY